jgi:signal transduction histidine kinase
MLAWTAEFRQRFSPLLHRFDQHISLIFTFWLSLIAVLPVAIMGSFTINQSSQQARDRVIAQLESVATIKYAEIQRWLDNQGTILDLLVADKEKKLAIVGLFQGSSQSQVVNELLTEHLSGQESFSEFFAYDHNGEIRASSSAAQLHKIVSRQPYFKPSLAGSHIQAPFYEASSGDLNIIISRPLYTSDGTLTGVIAGRLQLGELSQIMAERTGLGDSGETYLISAESNYPVTASRFEGYPLLRAYHSEGIDRALSGMAGAGTYLDYRGIPSIGVYRWMPELQSALLAEINESEALAPLSHLYSATVLTALGSIAITVGISMVLALRITRPIVSLTQVASQIAAGDYVLRAQADRRDEIGQLGRAFNTMTNKLTDTINELNLQMGEIERINQELTAASTQAQEAVRAKDAFLAVMSHELRTPLHAILSFAELIEMNGQVDDSTLRKVKRIRESGARLLSLVNNLLDISTIASGELHLTQAEVNLKSLIKGLAAQMEVFAQKKALKFNVEIDDSVPDEIVTNAEAVTKIVTNLLSNAFKFTKHGEVIFNVGHQDGKVHLKVIDTGIGIGPEMADTIFEPFRQVDNSAVKRAYEGSGLGLKIVQQLTLALGGSIEFTSTVGEGSVFNVILPSENRDVLEVNIV